MTRTRCKLRRGQLRLFGHAGRETGAATLKCEDKHYSDQSGTFTCVGHDHQPHSAVVLLIVSPQLARPCIASATSPESRMFAGDLIVLWVPLLLCLQAPRTPRTPAAPLSTGPSRANRRQACPRAFSVEKWTTIGRGERRLGELSASPSTLESSCTTASRTLRELSSRDIEDGYAERGAVQWRCSEVMQPWFSGSTVLKRVNHAT